MTTPALYRPRPLICEICAGEPDPSVGIFGEPARPVILIAVGGADYWACRDCAVEEGYCPECTGEDRLCRECAESLDAEARVDAILDGD